MWILIVYLTELEDATSLDRHCNHDYCLGGVIAINGKTGSMLWKVWLPKMVLAVHCDYDITADEVPDCVVTGKGGVSFIINILILSCFLKSRYYPSF